MATKGIIGITQLKVILSSLDSVQWESEYKFHPKRRWLIDLANLKYKIAIEYEGGVWTKGRHVRPKGYIGDCDKYNELRLHGWLHLQYTIEHLKEPDKIINQIRRAVALQSTR